MGNMVVDCAQKTNEFCVVAGFDKIPHNCIKTYQDINDVDCDFDVIVDFSLPILLPNVIELATKKHKNVVFATTGYTPNQLEQINNLSKTVAVLRSGNMSTGVNLVLDLVQRATKILGENFDVEIIEKHHNQKIDAPSGTAMMLADSIKNEKNDATYVYGRKGSSKRKKSDVTIHAVRGGTIVGEHDIIFAGEDEIITISHTALSRKIFANGTLRAVKFLSNKKCGLYSMKNALE